MRSRPKWGDHDVALPARLSHALATGQLAAGPPIDLLQRMRPLHPGAGVAWGDAVAEHLEGATIRKEIVVPGRLVNFVVA